MRDFTFYAPTRILFGKGKIAELPEHIAAIGKKVLLATGGGSVKRTGIYGALTELLQSAGIEWVELDGIQPNPKITSVEEGVKLCKQNKVKAIVALGGGSVIDCCKAIAAGVYHKGDLWEMVENNDITRALPLFTVLTMAATGSEMNGNAVISNMALNEKKAIKSELLKPVASVLDPTYTFTVPRFQTAAGVADIMSHILECYFSDVHCAAVQDGISEALLKVCIEYGRRAVVTPTDYTARANLMWASSLAINGLTSCGTGNAWSCHAIEHQLSAYYDITHGAGLAVVTIAWFDHIKKKKTLDKFVAYGKNVWGIKGEHPFAVAKEAIAKTREFFSSLGLPETLRGLGIHSSEYFHEMAKKAVKDDLRHAFVPLDEEDVVAIYSASL